MQILRDAATILEDPDLNIFNIPALNLQKQDGLNEISRVRPYEKRESRFLSVSSTEIDTSEVNNLIRVSKAEYEIGQDPREYRNVSQFGDTVDIKTTQIPVADDEVYLYCNKYHTLVDPPSTLKGAVNLIAGYAVGETSIVLDGLGTGIISSATLVTFTEIAGEYKVVSDVHITTNAATITITP